MSHSTVTHRALITRAFQVASGFAVGSGTYNPHYDEGVWEDVGVTNFQQRVLAAGPTDEARLASRSGLFYYYPQIGVFTRDPSG